MVDLGESLLPAESPTTCTANPVATAAGNQHSSSSAAGREPLFHGVDLPGLKKSGQSLRSWIRVDASTGESHAIEVDKLSIMRCCDLPSRDLRLFDPFFVYHSAILGREKAIVVNLEQIRCIITADEVLFLDSRVGCVLQCAAELQRRIAVHAGEGVGSPDYLTFEFRALEVVLDAACILLDGEAAELELEAYPLADELTSKISMLNLERVHRLKSKLVALTGRVQNVRDKIEQLMNDDGDMTALHLTEKKKRMEASFYDDQSLQGSRSTGSGVSVPAPDSPISSLPESPKLEMNLSFARSRHGSTKSASSTKENIEQLEMLLEAYFVVIDSTLNRLDSVKQYIDDSEDLIKIQMDNVRNQLIQFELLLMTATFVVAIYGFVVGILGMNFEIPLFKKPSELQWVLIISALLGVLIFCSFLFYFKYRRLMPL